MLYQCSNELIIKESTKFYQAQSLQAHTELIQLIKKQQWEKMQILLEDQKQLLQQYIQQKQITQEQLKQTDTQELHSECKNLQWKIETLIKNINQIHIIQEGLLIMKTDEQLSEEYVNQLQSSRDVSHQQEKLILYDDKNIEYYVTLFEWPKATIEHNIRQYGTIINEQLSGPIDLYGDLREKLQFFYHISDDPKDCVALYSKKDKQELIIPDDIQNDIQKLEKQFKQENDELIKNDNILYKTIQNTAVRIRQLSQQLQDEKINNKLSVQNEIELISKILSHTQQQKQITQKRMNLIQLEQLMIQQQIDLINSNTQLNQLQKLIHIPLKLKFLQQKQETIHNYQQSIDCYSQHEQELLEQIRLLNEQLLPQQSQQIPFNKPSQSLPSDNSHENQLNSQKSQLILYDDKNVEYKVTLLSDPPKIKSIRINNNVNQHQEFKSIQQYGDLSVNQEHKLLYGEIVDNTFQFYYLNAANENENLYLEQNKMTPKLEDVSEALSQLEIQFKLQKDLIQKNNNILLQYEKNLEQNIQEYLKIIEEQILLIEAQETIITQQIKRIQLYEKMNKLQKLIYEQSKMSIFLSLNDQIKQLNTLKIKLSNKQPSFIPQQQEPVIPQKPNASLPQQSSGQLPQQPGSRTKPFVQKQIQTNKNGRQKHLEVKSKKGLIAICLVAIGIIMIIVNFTSSSKNN
jgi:hypothetical protein